MVALLAGLFFYALSDVLLWQRIFEAHDMFQWDAQYQSGHIATLVALIAVGMILLYDTGIYALWWAGAFYTLAFGGFCDTLYYWIDHRAIPNSLPWLDSNPFVLFKPAGGWGLVWSSAIWLVVWIGALWSGPIAERLVRVARSHDRHVIDQGRSDQQREDEPRQEPAR